MESDTPHYVNKVRPYSLSHQQIIDIVPYNVYHIGVKYFDWDDDKNKWLMAHRGISFEMCVTAIENNNIVAEVKNNPPREHQKKRMLRIDNYIFVLVYVEDDEKIFFKTVYPSRKETIKYLHNNKQ